MFDDAAPIATAEFHQPKVLRDFGFVLVRNEVAVDLRDAPSLRKYHRM